MRDRWYSKGGAKARANARLASATEANTMLASRTQDWNEKYFTDFVKPAMEQANEYSKLNEGRQSKLFDLQYAQAQLADKRYRDIYMPAEDEYIAEAKKFSAPEEQERQAARSLGDLRTAEANQKAQLSRRFGSLGINPASPQVASAASDFALNAAAMEAGAATRARDAAKVLGLSLKSDLANMGKGGLSTLASFAGGAGGASSAGLSGSTNLAGVAPGGASGVNTGFGTAGSALGSNVKSATDVYTTAMQQPSGLTSALQGIGGLAGTAMMAYGPHSDRRLKTSAKRIATLAHDIGLWLFRYVWEPTTAPLRAGYMADEVEPWFPDAVTVDEHGYKRVNYSKVLI